MMLLPTCARESRWSATREKDRREKERKRRLTMSLFQRTRAYTVRSVRVRMYILCTRASEEERAFAAAVEYRRFGRRDKAKPRADEILRRTRAKDD